MDLKQIKKMAAKVMKCGVYKVKINNAEEANQAMTKDDVRILIQKKAITRRQDAPASKVRARKTAAQKKKGRKKGPGRTKGALGGRVDSKEEWMKKVRSLRKELEKIKPKIEEGNYRRLYKMIKGGYFRNKTHLKLYLTEKKLWKDKG